MRISFNYSVLFIALSIVSIKPQAKARHAAPVIKISEHMPENMMHELLFYAEALGINDSSTIQIRYSLRLPSMKNGLIQYRNTGFGKARHQVIIWINRRLTPSEQSMTLAHEMIHAAQYIHGTLTLHNEEATWHNQYFNVDRIPYADRPWEKEAHEWAYELRSDYLDQLKLKEQYQSGIHPFPESL